MDSISRMSSIIETARDLTLDAAREATSLRRNTRQNLTLTQLKKLLESRRDNEVLEGLRGVIARTSRGPQTGPPLLFSTVIKNVASPSTPVKKLVYIYLLQNAEAEPDTVLLAINTIQKSLSAPDPHLRALALRVMSGIRVPVIAQIVSLAIKKGSGDMSPLVRKAAALAIPKCWRLDPNTSPHLLEYLGILLGDKQYYVAGAAIAAFTECCPERIDLIHPHYRGLIRKLVDMDEWGQLATLRMMLFYARKCFLPPKSDSEPGASAGARIISGVASETRDGDQFYSEMGDNAIEQGMDKDLKLLLNSARPLLQSRNAAVVVAVTRLYLYLSPPNNISTYLDSAIGPLVALLRGAQDTQEIAFYNIIQVALVHPEPFVRYATRFLVKATDAPQIASLKFELLTIIFPHSSARLQSLILSELHHFSKSSSLDHVQNAVRAIGRCAQSCAPSSNTSSRCLQLLLRQLASSNHELVAESLTVIRHLIQANPDAHVDTVTRLAKHLDTLTHPAARASIIWLVGEYAGINEGNSVAADVLRILAKGFAGETQQSKLQIVLLAAKVYVHHLNNKQVRSSLESKDQNGKAYENEAEQTQGNGESDRIDRLWHYILLLTRYDTSYDLRDRARVYKALLATPSSTQLATLLLLAPKPVPFTPSPSESRKNFMLGSASLVVGMEEAGTSGLFGYEQLPDWVESGKEPDSILRDNANEGMHREQIAKSAANRLNPQTPGAVITKSSEINGPSGKNNGKSLDDWLAESDGSEHQESGGEDESTDESSSEDSEEESESESGSEIESEQADDDESSEDEHDDATQRLMKS